MNKEINYLINHWKQFNKNIKISKNTKQNINLKIYNDEKSIFVSFDNINIQVNSSNPQNHFSIYEKKLLQYYISKRFPLKRILFLLSLFVNQNLSISKSNSSEYIKILNIVTNKITLLKIKTNKLIADIDYNLIHKYFKEKNGLKEKNKRIMNLNANFIPLNANSLFKEIYIYKSMNDNTYIAVSQKTFKILKKSDEIINAYKFFYINNSFDIISKVKKYIYLLVDNSVFRFDKKTYRFEKVFETVSTLNFNGKYIISSKDKIYNVETNEIFDVKNPIILNNKIKLKPGENNIFLLNEDKPIKIITDFEFKINQKSFNWKYKKHNIFILSDDKNFKNFKIIIYKSKPLLIKKDHKLINHWNKDKILKNILNNYNELLKEHKLNVFKYNL